jgi:hypothetical protein
MITQDAFTKGKSLIDTILQKMVGLHARRTKAIKEILMLFLSFRGRINFEQMGRQGNLTEKSYRLHFEKAFDWMTFNGELISTACSDELCIGFDPSYISKSGKNTPGLGYYFSGVAGSYKRGLEIGNLAVIDIKQNTAYHLKSTTTPTQVSRKQRKQGDPTLVDHYLNTILESKEELQKISHILLVDGYFAKRKFIAGITNQSELEVISRFRDDANLRYLYKGEKNPGKGRPKQYHGKMDTKNLDKRRAKLVEKTDEYRVYEIIVNSVGLKMNIKLCYVEFLDKKGEIKTIKMFFSTNCQRSGLQIFKYYRSRFQMEFIFRDAKQYCGLENCQARSENKLDFHFNASLTSVNVAKITLRSGAETTQPMSYSINDLKVKFQNYKLIKRIFCIFGLDHKLIKIDRRYDQIVNYGTIAA